MSYEKIKFFDITWNFICESVAQEKFNLCSLKSSPLDKSAKCCRLRAKAWVSKRICNPFSLSRQR